MSGIPVVNGTRHSWASIKLNILGRTVTGVTKIDYSSMQKKENNYGAGSEPVSRGRGNSEYKCAIGLYKYEADAIKKLVPSGRLEDIAPFDIVIAYQPTGSDPIVTDILKYCEFTDDKRSSKQGDTKIEQTFDIIIGGIQTT